jgi:hypothetical protein
MATACLAWPRSIASVSTVGYTRHWALWTVAATERGLVILESGGCQAAAEPPPDMSFGVTRDRSFPNSKL